MAIAPNTKHSRHNVHFRMEDGFWTMTYEHGTPQWHRNLARQYLIELNDKILAASADPYDSVMARYVATRKGEISPDYCIN